MLLKLNIGDQESDDLHLISLTPLSIKITSVWLSHLSALLTIFSGENVEEAFLETAKKIFQSIQDGRWEFSKRNVISGSYEHLIFSDLIWMQLSLECNTNHLNRVAVTLWSMTSKLPRKTAHARYLFIKFLCFINSLNIFYPFLNYVWRRIIREGEGRANLVNTKSHWTYVFTVIFVCGWAIQC